MRQGERTIFHATGLNITGIIDATWTDVPGTFLILKEGTYLISFGGQNYIEHTVVPTYAYSTAKLTDDGGTILKPSSQIASACEQTAVTQNRCSIGGVQKITVPQGSTQKIKMQVHTDVTGGTIAGRNWVSCYMKVTRVR